jgi:hypothetical protein
LVVPETPIIAYGTPRSHSPLQTYNDAQRITRSSDILENETIKLSKAQQKAQHEIISLRDMVKVYKKSKTNLMGIFLLLKNLEL